MSHPIFARLQRAQLLLQTNRTAEAEKELRHLIADEPDCGHAYAVLALCVVGEGETPSTESFQLANKAVAIDPEDAFAHYVLSFVRFRRKEYELADVEIKKAIELGQDDPDYVAFRGTMLLSRNRREEAKEVFLEALRLDPDHHQSLTMLSQIESQLGNTAEAKRIAERAVQNSPEDAGAHVARGYSFIYANRPKDSFEAFREALRLEPNNEFARMGLLKALQMHHFFYRGMFQFFAWMGRLAAQYQWALIIGLFLGYSFLRKLMSDHPEWTPVILPVLVAYLLFALMSWISEPLSFTLLLFSQWGRLAMNWRQKLAGIVFGTFVPLGVLGVFYRSGPVWLFLLSVGLLLTVIPLTSTLRADEPKTRKVFGCYTLGMAVLMLLAYFANNPVYMVLAFWMLFGFQFLANFYSIRSGMPE